MKLLIVIAFIWVSFPTDALARQTGWIAASAWLKMSRKLDRSGEYPVSIKCKDSGNVGFGLKSGYTNVRTEKNTKKIAWYWAAGSRYGVVRPRLERKGYKRVSYGQFRRKSGLLVRCAIWHKN